jgi:hypothetical protein
MGRADDSCPLQYTPTQPQSCPVGEPLRQPPSARPSEPDSSSSCYKSTIPVPSLVADAHSLPGNGVRLVENLVQAQVLCQEGSLRLGASKTAVGCSVGSDGACSRRPSSRHLAVPRMVRTLYRRATLAVAGACRLRVTCIFLFRSSAYTPLPGQYYTLFLTNKSSHSFKEVFGIYSNRRYEQTLLHERAHVSIINRASQMRDHEPGTKPSSSLADRHSFARSSRDNGPAHPFGHFHFTLGFILLVSTR